MDKGIVYKVIFCTIFTTKEKHTCCFCAGKGNKTKVSPTILLIRVVVGTFNIATLGRQQTTAHSVIHACIPCSLLKKSQVDRLIVCNANMEAALDAWMNALMIRVSKTPRSSSRRYIERLKELANTDKRKLYLANKHGKKCLHCKACGGAKPAFRCANCHLTRFCDERCARLVWEKHLQVCETVARTGMFYKERWYDMSANALKQTEAARMKRLGETPVTAGALMTVVKAVVGKK